mgnify:CR=1 FL=1
MPFRMEKGSPQLFVRRLRLTGEEKQDREIIDNLTRSLRHRAHLSQEELAKKIGVSQPRIAQLETKDYREPMTLKRLAEIARECGFDVHIEFKEKAKEESPE